MPNQQADNFIAILRTACGNGRKSLQNPDWDQLADWAHTQSLTALFYTGASLYEEFLDWDSAKRKKMQMETISAVAIQAQRTQRFLEVYQKILEAGLQPLVLKGIVCRSLYGDLAEYRPSCDEDLYIEPEELPRCRDVLEANGFQMESEEAAWKASDRITEITFADHTGAGLHLEVHPALFGRQRSDLQEIEQYFSSSVSRKIKVTIHGVGLYTLAPTEHYLYVFFHLYKHFVMAGIGIRQMIDMMQMQQAWRHELDWNWIQTVLQQTKTLQLYSDIMAIGSRLGFAAPIGLPSKVPEVLLSDCLDGGIYGVNSDERIYSSHVTVAAMRGAGEKNYISMVFPPLQHMLSGWPYLVKKPWLLPVAWIQRLHRFLFVQKKSGVIKKAIQSGKGRTSLLQTYGLIP